MTARIKMVLFGPPGQGSFNEVGLAGAERARGAGHGVEVVWIEPADPQGRAQALAGLCASGADLVVAHGGQGDYPVSMVAERFPALRFVITQGSYVSANTACYDALQEQSAFLAGIVAAIESRSGIVGHMSGEKVRPGLKGRAAYMDGVRHAAVGATALTTFSGRQHDAQLAFDAFAAQAKKGADIIFAMIDCGRSGATEACRRFGIRQIGNALDWTVREPEVFVASAVADSGACIERAIEDFARGEVAYGATRHFGLEDPAIVRLALGKSVSHAARMAVDDWSQRLLDGRAKPQATYEGEEYPQAAAAANLPVARQQPASG